MRFLNFTHLSCHQQCNREWTCENPVVDASSGVRSNNDGFRRAKRGRDRRQVLSSSGYVGLSDDSGFLPAKYLDEDAVAFDAIEALRQPECVGRKLGDAPVILSSATRLSPARHLPEPFSPTWILARTLNTSSEDCYDLLAFLTTIGRVWLGRQRLDRLDSGCLLPSTG